MNKSLKRLNILILFFITPSFFVSHASTCSIVGTKGEYYILIDNLEITTDSPEGSVIKNNLKHLAELDTKKEENTKGFYYSPIQGTYDSRFNFQTMIAAKKAVNHLIKTEFCSE